MFDFQDLFQWDRFITPTIIKTFYWLVIGVIVLFGISGILSALSAMAISPFVGSNSTQPAPGKKISAHACVAPAPCTPLPWGEPSGRGSYR